jgi:hypothetical protein
MNRIYSRYFWVANVISLSNRQEECIYFKCSFDDPRGAAEYFMEKIDWRREFELVSVESPVIS